MREGKRLDDKFAEELLDVALKNYGAEPMAGLEERVLENLRRQSRVARPVLWRLTSAMIAAAAVVLLFAVDHLVYHRIASNPDVAEVSKPDNLRGRHQTDQIAVQESPKPAKSLTAYSSRRQYLAFNLKSRRKDIRQNSGLQVDEVRISEIKLDDIVIGSN